MTGKLQTMIDQANQRTQAVRKRQFVKKATDAQLLTELASKATAACVAYKGLLAKEGLALAPARLLIAIRELQAMIDIVDRRSK